MQDRTSRQFAHFEYYFLSRFRDSNRQLNARLVRDTFHEGHILLLAGHQTVGNDMDEQDDVLPVKVISLVALIITSIWGDDTPLSTRQDGGDVGGIRCPGFSSLHLCEPQLGSKLVGRQSVVH